jgi:hypothetical protein
VPLYKNEDDFRVFCGMMNGLAFLPVPQVEELVVPALAHVVGSGITVNCGIMYVPNGWWKHRWATC